MHRISWNFKYRFFTLRSTCCIVKLTSSYYGLLAIKLQNLQNGFIIFLMHIKDNSKCNMYALFLSDIGYFQFYELLNFLMGIFMLNHLNLSNAFSKRIHPFTDNWIYEEPNLSKILLEVDETMKFYSNKIVSGDLSK